MLNMCLPGINIGLSGSNPCSFEKAITIQPNYAAAQNNLGKVLQDLGEHQKAISFYQKAIKIQPI